MHPLSLLPVLKAKIRNFDRKQNRPLVSGSETSFLIGNGEKLVEQEQKLFGGPKKQSNFLFGTLVVFLVANIIMSIVLATRLQLTNRHAGLNLDIKRVAAYSPILDSVDIRLHSKTVNGSFRDNSTIWRMPPSPEVDAAWDRISAEDTQLILVSADDVSKSGKDPRISVQAPTSWGAGKDAYIAQVEVFHQIHCLNKLRKEVNAEYYFGNQSRNELRTSHVTHCIHMLLQQLMCSADVGIITHDWLHDPDYIDPKTRPFPDFSVTKQCRDFEAVMTWLREEGGVKDFESKFPMEYPHGVPFKEGRGYSSAW